MLYHSVFKGINALIILLMPFVFSCVQKPKRAPLSDPTELPHEAPTSTQQGDSNPTTTPEAEVATSTPAVIPAAVLGDCPQRPAINQISNWWATTEGQMVPSSGTLVKKENGQSIARITWQGEDWHVVPVWIGNEFEFGADLTKSKTLTLTYQSPADFYVQMRPAFGWSGGAQWGTKFPKSPDKMNTVIINLVEGSWGLIPGLDMPTYPFSKALADVRGFVIVGKSPGDYAFTAMIIDNFVPPCK